MFSLDKSLLNLFGLDSSLLCVVGSDRYHFICLVWIVLFFMNMFGLDSPLYKCLVWIGIIL